MAIRIVPLLLCILTLACVQRVPPPGTPAPAPTAAIPSPGPMAAAPNQGDPPYQTLRVAELWEFRPDKVSYDFSACVEVLKPGQEPAALGNTPIWKGDRPTTSRWAGDMAIVMFDPIAYPEDTTYQTLMTVVKPVKPARKGDKLQARYHLEFRDAPYLHKQANNRRLLSIRMEPRTAIARQNLLFAFPANKAPVTPTDMPPTQVIQVPGWSVYRYEISKVPEAVIHLNFELSAATKPLPTLEQLLPPGESAECP